MVLHSHHLTNDKLMSRTKVLKYETVVTKGICYSTSRILYTNTKLYYAHELNLFIMLTSSVPHSYLITKRGSRKDLTQM